MPEFGEAGRSVFFSQKVMLNLVDDGMSRENAYKIVQTLALKSVDENIDFQDPTAQPAPKI